MISTHTQVSLSSGKVMGKEDRREGSRRMAERCYGRITGESVSIFNGAGINASKPSLR